MLDTGDVPNPWSHALLVVIVWIRTIAPEPWPSLINIHKAIPARPFTLDVLKHPLSNP